MGSARTVALYSECLKTLEKANIYYSDSSDLKGLMVQIRGLKTGKGVFISASSYRLYLNALIWYYKSKSIDPLKLSELRHEIYNLKLADSLILSQNVLSDAQSVNYLSWLDILKVYNNLKLSAMPTLNQHKNFALLSCYILLPPRRLKDYGLMHISDSDSLLDIKFNYYVKGVFIFNNYKTRSYFGVQRVKVPDDLDLILREYIDSHKIVGSLFGLSCPALEHRLLRIFERCTGKSISVNILRHSYITYLKDSKRMLGNEKTISKLMAHSLTMQNEYYKDPLKKLDNVLLSTEKLGNGILTMPIM